MPLFDAYLVVDWSSNSKPKKGENSLWLGWRTRDGVETPGTFNPKTRAAAKVKVLELLQHWKAAGYRTLVSFDFGYSYPRGTAQALRLGEGKPWRLLWKYLAKEITDAANNENNRFQVAARMNERMERKLFWACPESEKCDHLTTTKVEKADHRLRLTEESIPGVQEAWKLFTSGSVGGQMLMGIPILEALREHEDLSAISQVWPFETGFDPDRFASAGPSIVHAECWPGILGKLPETSEIRDAVQVRELARAFQEWDDTGGELRRLFETPEGLTPDQVQVCVDEEGWILGGPGPGASKSRRDAGIKPGNSLPG